MKYIRTKDGVYEVEAITEEIMDYETGQTILVYHLSDGNYKTNYDEFKEADTIEELCDEFVAIYDNKPHFHCLERAIQYADDNKVYGAIWTDKGLIYVAKMNNKGELELI